MKKIVFLIIGLISTCAFAQTSGSARGASVGSSKPGISVSEVVNMTGQEAARKGESVMERRTKAKYSRDGDTEKLEVSRNVVNTTGVVQLPDVAVEVASNALKTALANSGMFRVIDYSPLVEREINNKMVKESRDGYRETSSTGVAYLLTGSINNYRVRRETRTVYGVTYNRREVSISIDVKLLDLDQNIIASMPMTKKLTRNIPEGVETEGTDDDWEEPLRMAIDSSMPEFLSGINISPDAKGKGSNLSSKTPMVTFEVKSNPEGADVEFNGEFKGNTPCSVTAPAVPGKLKISFAGYVPWEKTVTPSKTLRITPTLQKK